MRKRTNCRCCSNERFDDGCAVVLGIVVWGHLVLWLSSSAVLAGLSTLSYKSSCPLDTDFAHPSLSVGTWPFLTESSTSIPSIAWWPSLSCLRCCTSLLLFVCSTGRIGNKRLRLLSLGLATSSVCPFSWSAAEGRVVSVKEKTRDGESCCRDAVAQAERLLLFLLGLVHFGSGDQLVDQRTPSCSDWRARCKSQPICSKQR